MTIFVATIFLPYTVHFDFKQVRSTPPSAEPRTPPQFIEGGYAQEHETFGLAVQDATEPQVYVPTTDLKLLPSKGEPNILLPEVKVEGPESLPHEQLDFSPTFLSSIAPNEPHSPAWGNNSTSYFQPKSGAKTPPTPSISREARSPDRRGTALARSGLSSREDSHERVWKMAEWSIQPAEQGNGGLRNAINAACKDDPDMEKTWVGTLGMPTDALDSSRKFDIEGKLADEYDCLAVFPTDSDLDGHYSHFCKTMLWPLLHSQIPDNPKSKAYQDHSWIYYVRINQAFADKIVKYYKRNDIIWIHDYHLMLVPSMIRKKLPDAKIGFFLHVAFPSSEVFRCLATRNELLDGLLGANLIGFQTQEYCNHFLQTCNRLLCVEPTIKGVQLENRFVDVTHIPIGVDQGLLDLRRIDPRTLDWIQRLQKKYAGKHLIVARDKLDHVRGVRQKLLSYEYFLNKYPEYHEKVVLIQVATSTTEEAELNAAIAEIVTRINSKHSSLSYQPLVFLKQDLEYHQYLAMLTVADILMITSLREGMNLTSHEFIICQDGAYGDKKFGSLILSEFTGSSTVFQGGELLINPWDYRQCSNAILTSLQMDPSEKMERWSKLMNSVQAQSALHWVHTFLSELDKAWDLQFRQHTLSIPRLSISTLCEKYKAANSRLFMLDYEGTLAPLDTPKTIIFNSPQRTIDTLNELLSDSRNVVYVMSNKRPEELESLFQRVPGLGVVAENGSFVREAGTDEWDEVADMAKVKNWKKSVRKILDYYQERAEDSSIEERHCSVVFRYKGVKDADAGGSRHVGGCADQINDSCRNLGVHAVPIEGGIVVESTEVNKRTAAERILEGLLKKNKTADGTAKAPDFLLVAGHSRDDEVLYRWADELEKSGAVRDVTTVSLSSRNTEAHATLTQGVTGILSVLRKLAAPKPTAKKVAR